MVSGGDRLSDCLLSGVGIIGLGAGILAAPATGMSSLALAGTLVAGLTGGIGVGASLAGCLDIGGYKKK